jgi:hypothetical protein
MSRHLTPSALRRAAARLRAGEITPANPNVSPIEAAEQLEREVASRQAVRRIILAGNPYYSQKALRKAEARRQRRRMDTLHRLKKSPEATDPTSPVAERVRRIHHLRRQEQGRSRKRKSGK